MSAQVSSTGDREFSGKITRQIVGKAADLFGDVFEEGKLDRMLSNVLQDADDLADSERAQLARITSLLSQADGQSGDHGLHYAGDFEVEASPDGMLLTLHVRPPVASGRPVAANDVLQHLRERRITMGVDMVAIRRCVERAAAGEEAADVIIVRGRPPREGEDARIECFARRSSDSELQEMSPGARETGDILLCRQGDVVMRYIPPISGEAGHSALGEPIQPPPPQDLSPSVGRNIRREGNDFIADVNGVVLFQDCAVEARKALILSTDVTRQDEPIDFDGEVYIRGGVRAGASIKATGNITVDGPVEAAEIQSTDGDVVLHSGVAGQHAAIVHAARDVVARFAESASVVAGRDIVLQVGSLHSRLIAHHHVLAVQGKGHLVGGVIMAGERVQAKQLGAKGGVNTDVTVGVDRQVMETLSQIDQVSARAKQRRDTCADLIDQIERAVGDPLKLSPKELNTYTRLRQLQLVCDVQIRKLNHRRKELMAECVRNHGGKIEVLMEIMSNVRVSIGSATLEPEPRSGACTIAFDEQKERIVIRRS